MRLCVQPGEGKVQIIDVKVNDIVLRDIPEQLLQHHEVMRDRVDHVGRQPERLLNRRDERRPGHRVTARVESYIMPLLYQRFSEVRYNPFRSTIQLGRNTFVKW